MDIDIIKESIIEYVENIYALGISKMNNNLELKNLLNELTAYEDKLRKCYDLNQINNYKKLVIDIIDRIEVIINE